MWLSLATLAAFTPAVPPVSAPISNVRYEVTFTRETAAERSLGVAMRFSVAGPGEVLLSLPSWTPGAYDVTNFARWVSDFRAEAGGKSLRWDKLDYDTWRVRPAGAGEVEVRFDFHADSLDNAMAWSRAEFAFFNGTNVFLYPEGRPLSYPASVTIRTERDWRVATGMSPGKEPGTYQEGNYHDLVDMPFFVGKIDYDSAQVGVVQARLATYPAGTLTGAARGAFWSDYRKLFAPQAAVFGETPFTSYTTLIVFDSAFGGGSALEHQNSHMGIYAAAGIGQDWITSITAHEMIHAWNVKRLRPADMFPYRYDVAQPTPWLWVSEGITDYYADLVLLRAGIADSSDFLRGTANKLRSVFQLPPVALEDASLNTWIHPTDGTDYIYYDKGSLAGFLLDIMIRDGSNNARSLDDVMREMYRTTYKAGRGFTGADWWAAVSRASGGKSFAPFERCCIDGREPFPWDSVLPLAGLTIVSDSVQMPRLGINVNQDSTGSRIVAVQPGGAAAEAGLMPDDILLEIGGISTEAPDVFDQFRTRYGNREGAELPFKIRRGGREMVLNGKVRFAVLTQQRLDLLPNPSAKAVRVRHGLFSGTTN